jgi:cell division protein FtsW
MELAAVSVRIHGVDPEILDVFVGAAESHFFLQLAQGGLFGSGLGGSAEKYLYLPEAETDFIFSIIGEELGFIGAFLVIALFFVFLFAGLRLAQSIPDRFGSTVCGSFAIIIAFQAFLNIGCTIGVFPTTGKPLPFISSGGSSLIASFMMVGIVMSVSEDVAGKSIYDRRRDALRVVRKK